MKKILFALFGLVILFSSCDKDDTDNPDKDAITVKKEQWAMAINYTATWCGPCGSWGAPLIKELGALNRVMAITAHASGDPMHIASYYGQLEGDRTNGGGIPAFWVNDEKVSTGNAVSTATASTAMIPSAALGMKAEKVGTKFNVKVKAEWYTAGTGDYYLSVYLLEDGIDGSATAGSYKQNGTSDAAYKHMFVFRTAATPTAFGEMVKSNPAAGNTIEKEYNIDILPDWQKTVYPVAILWKYDPASAKPNYKFINAIK